MQGVSEKPKVQTHSVFVVAEHKPSVERMLHALMLVLEVDRPEIDRLLKERRERLDQIDHKGIAA